jgi:hypothetical protein
MPRRVLFIAIPLTLILATAVVVRALPDGQPDITGDWTTKVKVKGFAMDPNEDDEKGKFTVTMRFSQMGEGLSVEVLVPGEPSFHLSGEIGNGHFWASGETEGGRPRLMIGHVARNEKKLKGMLLEAWNDGVDEVKFSAKRAN